MKQKLLAIGAFAALFAAACDSKAPADEKNKSSDSAVTAAPKEDNKSEEWVAVDSATEMKAWMEYATPGEAHKLLAKADGTWSGQTTMWMGIGAPPATSTGTMVNKMLLGGRYQTSSFTGSMMGMPFEGIGTTGFDNAEKKFISTWIDNMGTGIMKMEGTWDSVTKTIVYTGKCKNPANGKEYSMREVYTFIDDNNQTMEMYGPDAKTGKEYKSMEIKLTRKK